MRFEHNTQVWAFQEKTNSHNGKAGLAQNLPAFTLQAGYSVSCNLNSASPQVSTTLCALLGERVAARSDGCTNQGMLPCDVWLLRQWRWEQDCATTNREVHYGARPEFSGKSPDLGLQVP